MENEYPLEDFLRDYDTVTALAESEPEADFMRSCLHLRAYMHATYAPGVARSRRSMALGYSLNYLAEHHDDFDVGEVAVVGERGVVVSDSLLTAIHTLIVGWVLTRSSPHPTPDSVRNMALALSRTRNLGEAS